MKAVVTYLLLTIICSACSVITVPPPGSTSILVTVEQDRTTAFAGSPSRILAYTGKYAKSNKAQQVINQLSTEYSLSMLDGWPIKSLGVYCQVFAVANNDVHTVLDQLRADARVESVQRMNLFEVQSSPDPYRKLQKNLDQMGIAAVLPATTGKNIRIAVIDTPIDTKHIELKGHVLFQKTLFGNGRYDGGDRHGTAIAGVIAAKHHNGTGIHGIAPGADLLGLAACWPEAQGTGRCSSFTLAQALDLAIDRHAQVINLSLSGPADPLLSRILREAMARGIWVVGAYDEEREHAFPGGVEGVLCVSSFGSYVNSHGLFAPGEEILTTVPNNSYDFVSGHSIAAAHISGLAALALEQKPSLTAASFRQALLKTIQGSKQIKACQLLQTLDNSLNCPRGDAITSHTLR